MVAPYRPDMIVAVSQSKFSLDVETGDRPGGDLRQLGTNCKAGSNTSAAQRGRSTHRIGKGTYRTTGARQHEVLFRSARALRVRGGCRGHRRRFEPWRPMAPAQAQAADAVIRAAHFSPTTPGVDVYLSPFSGSAVEEGVAEQRLLRRGQSLPTAHGRYLHGGDASSRGRPDHHAGVDLDPRCTSRVRPTRWPEWAPTRPCEVWSSVTTSRHRRAGQGRVRVIQAASRAPIVNRHRGIGRTGHRQGCPVRDGHRLRRRARRHLERQGSVGEHPESSTTASPVAVQAAARSPRCCCWTPSPAGITLRTVLDSSSSGVQPVGSVPGRCRGAATTFSRGIVGPDGSRRRC